MALLWLDSFDTYATADMAAKYPTTGGSIVAGAGRRSTACLQGSSGPTLNVPFTTALCICGAAIKPVNLAAQGALFRLFSGATAQFSLAINTSGFLQACRGDYVGTVLGTATGSALSVASFFFVELKVLIHPTAGTVQVRVNGLDVPGLTLSGVNTAGQGSAGWDNIRLSGGGSSLNIDDWYLLDGNGPAPWNDLLDDCRVDARYPQGPGANAQWTIGGTTPAPTNWQGIDETPANADVDYNSTQTVGALDTVDVQSSAVPGAPILGLQLNLMHKKTDAGTCQLAPVVRSGGTNYPGAPVAPATSYLYTSRPYATDPATAAQWTEPAFNAAEFGYQRTA